MKKEEDAEKKLKGGIEFVSGVFGDERTGAFVY